MRKTILTVLTGFLAFSLTVNAAAFSHSSNSDYAAAAAWTNQETGYHVVIEDDADLLDKTEETLLALKMQKITAYGNAAFKSLSSNGYSASYYAGEYYHELFGQQSGTLFLIDMDNREIYLFSDGAIYKTVTTAYANTITDNVYRYASDRDYYNCAYKAFEQIHSLLSGRKIAQPMKYISNILLALILAALINYFIVMLLSSTAKPSRKELLGSFSTSFKFTDAFAQKTHQTKSYSPKSSGSSGRRSRGRSHHSSGGHHSGGRHHSSGGHHSGGGGGHRF